MRIIVNHGIAVLSLISSTCVLTTNAAHAHHSGLVQKAHHKQQDHTGSVEATNETKAPDDIATVDDLLDLQSQHLPPALVDTHQDLRVHHNSQGIYVKTLQALLEDDLPVPTRRRSYSPPSTASSEETNVDDARSTNAIRIIETPAPNFDEDLSGASPVDPLENGIGARLELRELQDFEKPLRPRQADGYQPFVLGDTQPSSTISAVAAGSSDLCPTANGTTFKSASGISYQVLCNIDFPGHDFPFQKAGSLEECIRRCDVMNWIHHGVVCLAGIFTPARVSFANDCYLKSYVGNPKYTTLEIHGLVRLSAIRSVTSSLGQASKTRTLSSRSVPADTATASSTAPTNNLPGGSNPPPGNEPGVTYASGRDVIEPNVADSHLQGPSRNTPTKQYLDVKIPKVATLGTNLLKKIVNTGLTDDYPIAPQTGVLDVNGSNQAMLSPLDGTPHISRDGGGGGYLNGQHLFVFCDTGSYTQPRGGNDGKFVGFVSSSVAVDTGMNGLNNEPLNLKDGIGQWYGANGRQRGFAPLTEGELAYNLKMQGGGQRYAIWPEAPILPLDSARGIIYAPIVYDNVDKSTNIAHFTYTGATLLTVTADNKAGPIAERTVTKIFNQGEIEWGCAGGIRSWGPSGVGGDDGQVYIFGNTKKGILLARTDAANVADRDSFEFWDGNSWQGNMLDESSNGFFIKGNFMDISLFYSPRHLTFIIVYLTTYADNTFYYRYLKADRAIIPHYAPGGDPTTDYVEDILKYPWSDRKVLYKAPPSKSGKYIYAGAVHAGYYGSNDITNGGTRMLLSWTAPTGENPASHDSEYQIITAGIDWE